ncbi:MAG: phosphoribosylformylglycinamidine synthase subunit PurQ [Bacteroidia bacterium]|jgi:phosphoribosylformylglycinamidine synthase|nr:phosphoribosylformylglycinamidine synthase subunit PurQ [Bacteroidia bacterium]
MKVGVVIFPGSNCDQDAVYAFQHEFSCEVVTLWHKDHDLQGVDLVFLPGGFSYGDYLRSGAIARFSPIMQNVIEFAGKGGLVFGVCNGFQVLCESGLLPGALLRNTSVKFNCQNVFIKPQTNNSLITNQLDLNKALKIPIAHGEGRFYCDEQTLASLKTNDQILFTYCNEQGIVTPESNPNGSLENIAGICNHTRNVFGMMPHPERAVDADLYNTDGRGLFESVLQLASASR